MNRTEIRVEPVKTFFDRGRAFAKLADRGSPIPAGTVVAFEDVESLLQVLTRKRLLLLRKLGESPSSVTDLARKLNRDRSAVTRDVRLLERFGVVRIAEKPLPGHGKQKWITPIARHIRLAVQL